MSTYATWDPSRPGFAGRVSLSSGNTVATLSANGSSEYGTVVLTDPIDFSAASKKYIEIGLDGSGDPGIGVASSGSAINAPAGYLGENATQMSVWADSSFDAAGTLSVVGFRPNYVGATRIKLYLDSGGLYYGVVGAGTTGWWNPAASNFTGTPGTTLPVITGFGAGVLFSIGGSTLNASVLTTHADPAEWLDTPPSGSTAFLGSASGIGLTGTAATSATGTIGVSRARAIPGSSATASAGTLKTGRPIAGQAATSARGTITARRSLTLAGSAATASAGTAVPKFSFALTGVAATSAAGTVTVGAGAAVALTGSATSTGAGTVGISAGGSATLSGSAATVSTGTEVPAIGIPASGESAAATAGSVGISAGGSAGLSGNEASSAAGSPAAAATFLIAGSEAVSALGAVSASAGGGATLSGASATAEGGTIQSVLSRTLAGTEATPATGLVAISRALQLSGEQAVFAQGAVSTAGNVNVALIGVVASADSEAAKAAHETATVGNSATSAAGNVAVATGATVALSGLQAQISAGQIVVSRSLQLTGQAATVTQGAFVFGGSGLPMLRSVRVTHAGQDGFTSYAQLDARSITALSARGSKSTLATIEDLD